MNRQEDILNIIPDGKRDKKRLKDFVLLINSIKVKKVYSRLFKSK